MNHRTSSGGRKRILVVDDDAACLEMTVAALEAEGYLVETARDGAEALEHVRRSPPDAIVLDLQMPGLDGQSFMAMYTEELDRQAAPVALVSASPELRSVALAWKVQACLTKPFDIALLLSTVSSLTLSDPVDCS